MDFEPVADNELIYRRVPTATNWYVPAQGLSPEAFGPHKTNDATGLSVSRAGFLSIEEAARGRPGKSYYVAVLRVADLRQHGMDVVPRPLPDNPGHAEIPQLTSADRKDDRTLEFQQLLVRLCIRVEGPFTTP